MQKQAVIFFKGIDGVFIQKTLFITLGLMVGLMVPLVLLMPEAIEDGALIMVMVPPLAWMFISVLYASVHYSMTVDATGITIEVTEGNWRIGTGRRQFYRWDEITSWNLGEEAGNIHVTLIVKGRLLAPRWQKITWHDPGMGLTQVQAHFTRFSSQFAGDAAYVPPAYANVWALPRYRVLAGVFALVLISFPLLMIWLGVPLNQEGWIRYCLVALAALGFIVRVWLAKKD